MKLNGKTVKEPKIEDLINEHPLFFEKLEKLIGDENIFNSVKCSLVQLKWYELFCEMINKEHGGNLSPERQKAEYNGLYESILENYFALKPYFHYPEKPMLNIPFKNADTYQGLSELLQDNQEALELIKKLYSYQNKRKNKRELNNELVEKALNRLENPKHYFRYAKWKYVQPIKNKEYIFKNVSEFRALEFKDENGNAYHTLEKITVTNIDEKIILQNNIDYRVDGGGIVVILPPLLKKCSSIKVKISTKKQKFKQISI